MDLIKQESVNLGNGILMADFFINHQVDPRLMEECGRELARRFTPAEPTCVLTAEIFRIAPALMTAKFLKVPVVFARNNQPITLPDQVNLTLAPSHT